MIEGKHKIFLKVIGVDRSNLTPARGPLPVLTSSEIHQRHCVRPQPTYQPFLVLAALTLGFGMGSTWLMLIPDGMMELMVVGIIPLGLCAAFFRPRE